MPQSTPISEPEYLTLVSLGYDGNIVIKWTKRRAIEELQKRRPVPRRQPPQVSLADALAAGLDEKSAQILVESSAKTSKLEAQPQNKERSQANKKRIIEICFDVLNVIGMGKVDALVLNHYIRDVICALLNDRRNHSKDSTSDRICRLFSESCFVQDALDALSRIAQQPSAARTTGTATLALEITDKWIRDGGWRAYWFCLDLLSSTRPRLKGDLYGIESLDMAVAVAFGYAQMPLSPKT